MEEWAKRAPTLAAILALGTALVVALFQGVDGTLHMLLVIGIAGLGGYQLREWLGRH